MEGTSAVLAYSGLQGGSVYLRPPKPAPWAGQQRLAMAFSRNVGGLVTCYHNLVT